MRRAKNSLMRSTLIHEPLGLEIPLRPDPSNASAT